MASSSQATAKKPSNVGPMASSRAKKRAAGLVPKEVWIHPDNHMRLKAAEKRLQKPPADSQ